VRNQYLEKGEKKTVLLTISELNVIEIISRFMCVTLTC